MVPHQDNALAHTAMYVKLFLAKYNSEHPPYSPDLAPCDFNLFPKSALRRTRSQSVAGVKEKGARVLQELTEQAFEHCFEQWKLRMERCEDREGVYIGGDRNYIQFRYLITTPRIHSSNSLKHLQKPNNILFFVKRSLSSNRLINLIFPFCNTLRLLPSVIAYLPRHEYKDSFIN